MGGSDSKEKCESPAVDNSTHEKSTGFHFFEMHGGGFGQSLLLMSCCAMMGMASALAVMCWRIRHLGGKLDNRPSKADYMLAKMEEASNRPVSPPPVAAPAPVPALGYVSQPLQAVGGPMAPLMSPTVMPWPGQALPQDSVRDSVRREMRAQLVEMNELVPLSRAFRAPRPTTSADGLEP